MFGDEKLVGAIYETIAAPSQWPSLIDELARRSGGIGGSLFVVGQHGMDWLATPSTLEFMQDYDAGRWSTNNPRVSRLFAKRHRGFINDLDLFTVEELDETPIYQDFLYPRGLGWVTATFAPLPNAGTLVLSIDRSVTSGPASPEEIQQFDRLHSHLLRAAWIGATLRIEAAVSTTRALDAMNVAAALIGHGARIQHANTAFEALAPSLRIRINGTLTSCDARSNELLSTGLGAAIEQLPLGSSFTLRPKGHEPLLLHLLPVFGYALDVFSGSSAILVATSAQPGGRVNAALLSSMFDLTPTEGRVAVALAEGLAPREVANRHGTSIDTVRTQIKSLLSKTGNSRQIDLIRQLSSLSARAP